MIYIVTGIILIVFGGIVGVIFALLLNRYYKNLF